MGISINLSYIVQIVSTEWMVDWLCGFASSVLCVGSAISSGAVRGKDDQYG